MFNFSDADSQSLIYYIILLVFLLSSFFIGRKINIKQSIKYLLIWSGVALVAIALYSYRFEFTDLKNRVLGELSPASARQDAGGRLVINMSQDGHFYVNTRINNRMVRFLIDTGASDVVLNLKDARKIGLDPKKLQFNKRYNTANGVVLGASVKLEEVSLGGVIFYNVDASVNSANLDISLLGMDFLKKFRRYEFSRNRLILEK